LKKYLFQWESPDMQRYPQSDKSQEIGGTNHFFSPCPNTGWYQKVKKKSTQLHQVTQGPDWLTSESNDRLCSQVLCPEWHMTFLSYIINQNWLHNHAPLWRNTERNVPCAWKTEGRLVNLWHLPEKPEDVTWIIRYLEF
jgi:hypothetical protein